MSRTYIFFHALVLYLFLLIPLAFGFSKVSQFEYAKYYLLILSTQIIWICYFVFQIFKDRLSLFRFDWLDAVVLAFLFINILSALFGLDFKDSLFGTPPRYQGVGLLIVCVQIYFLSRYITGEKEKMEKIIGLCAISAVVIFSFLGVVQFYSFFIFPSLPIYLYYGRVGLTFGNPNSYAGFLLVLLPSVLYFAGSRWKQIGIIILISYALFLSGSRVGIILSGSLLFFYFVFENKKNRMIFKTISGSVIVILVLISIFLFNRGMLYQERAIIYSETLRSIQKSPLLGYGLSNFDKVFPSTYKLPVDSAHNLILDTTLGSGILGLILFLMIIVQALFRSSGFIRMSLGVLLLFSLFHPLSIVHHALIWFFVGFSCRKNDISEKKALHVHGR